MKARDGIEAQHGLNDVFPGDEYPSNAPQAEEADAKRLAEAKRTIEQRAWSIVHEAGPAWWNWYCTRYPNSKSSKKQLRDEMAHACVVAALKNSDAALAEAERRGAEKMRDRCEAKAREVASGPYGSIAGDAIRTLPLE